jgi:hypothetical protein
VQVGLLVTLDFATEEGRQAHLSGQVAAALGQIAGELLDSPPDIRPFQVLASKDA